MWSHRSMYRKSNYSKWSRNYEGGTRLKSPSFVASCNVACHKWKPGVISWKTDEWVDESNNSELEQYYYYQLWVRIETIADWIFIFNDELGSLTGQVRPQVETISVTMIHWDKEELRRLKTREVITPVDESTKWNTKKSSGNWISIDQIWSTLLM